MSQAQPASNVLLVEVPPQFIALCHASGVSPQATLRGIAAMLCGLRYDEDNRLLPLDSTASRDARDGPVRGSISRGSVLL
jgi:hypothetical protein